MENVLYLKLLRNISKAEHSIFKKYQIDIYHSYLEDDYILKGTSGFAGTTGTAGTASFGTIPNSSFGTSGVSGTNGTSGYPAYPKIHITFVRKLKLLRLYDIHTHDDIINLLFDKELCELIGESEMIGTGTSGTSGSAGT